MVFDSSYFTIWFAFTVLEAFGIAYIRKPEYRGIRAFLIFRLVSDFILFAVSMQGKMYWDIEWSTKEIELVWLALIAGHIIQPGRAWRLPAFTIAAMCFHYLWSGGWPFVAKPEEMFLFERTCSAVILGTLLIGGLLILRQKQALLASAVAILAATDMVYALSYQAENYSPKVAACIWVVGLGTLVAAAKGCPGSLQRLLSCAATAGGEAPDSRSATCIRLPLTPRPGFWS